MLDEGFRGFLLCLRQLAGAFGGFADLSFESAEEQLDLIQQFLGVGELTRVVDAVGLRRQRTDAEARFRLVADEWQDAHDRRFWSSVEDFDGWVLEEVVSGEFDEDELLADNIPLGSSMDEMRPVLHDLIERVGTVEAEMRDKLKPDDNVGISLSELEARGLAVSEADERLYGAVLDRIRKEDLPAEMKRTLVFPYDPGLSVINTPASNITTARRLDESIRQEQELWSRKNALDVEINRLTSELEALGRPAGVTSAIVILTIYSLLGMAAPLVVMALHLPTLEPWLEWSLLAAFLVGLAAVLGYIFWYARSLNDPVRTAAEGGNLTP